MVAAVLKVTVTEALLMMPAVLKAAVARVAGPKVEKLLLWLQTQQGSSEGGRVGGCGCGRGTSQGGSGYGGGGC